MRFDSTSFAIGDASVIAPKEPPHRAPSHNPAPHYRPAPPAANPSEPADALTRKICRAVAAIKTGRQSELALGDTSAQRDWGHARDYVRGMWLAMQHTTPEDFVFATGKVHRVQDIVELAFQSVDLDWKQFVRQEKSLLRPADPRQVVGDANKAKKLLGWEPEITFKQTIAEMVSAELRALA